LYERGRHAEQRPTRTEDGRVGVGGERRTIDLAYKTKEKKRKKKRREKQMAVTDCSKENSKESHGETGRALTRLLLKQALSI
jgi:hypothetical protein